MREALATFVKYSWVPSFVRGSCKSHLSVSLSPLSLSKTTTLNKLDVPE